MKSYKEQCPHKHEGFFSDSHGICGDYYGPMRDRKWGNLPEKSGVNYGVGGYEHFIHKCTSFGPNHEKIIAECPAA